MMKADNECLIRSCLIMFGRIVSTTYMLRALFSLFFSMADRSKVRKICLTVNWTGKTGHANCKAQRRWWRKFPMPKPLDINKKRRYMLILKGMAIVIPYSNYKHQCDVHTTLDVFSSTNFLFYLLIDCLIDWLIDWFIYLLSSLSNIRPCFVFAVIIIYSQNFLILPKMLDYRKNQILRRLVDWLTESDQFLSWNKHVCSMFTEPNLTVCYLAIHGKTTICWTNGSSSPTVKTNNNPSKIFNDNQDITGNEHVIVNRVTEWFVMVQNWWLLVGNKVRPCQKYRTGLGRN